MIQYYWFLLKQRSGPQMHTTPLKREGWLVGVVRKQRTKGQIEASEKKSSFKILLQGPSHSEEKKQYFRKKHQFSVKSQKHEKGVIDSGLTWWMWVFSFPKGVGPEHLGRQFCLLIFSIHSNAQAEGTLNFNKPHPSLHLIFTDVYMPPIGAYMYGLVYVYM